VGGSGGFQPDLVVQVALGRLPPGAQQLVHRRQHLEDCLSYVADRRGWFLYQQCGHHLSTNGPHPSRRCQTANPPRATVCACFPWLRVIDLICT
jgi:hypothetical protein